MRFAIVVALTLVAGLGVAVPARAVVPGDNGQIVFSRQICTSDTDPCWEIVVANAGDTRETVVAGPYPRGVWDDHFIANWAPDGRSVIFMADLGGGQAIWQVRADGTGLHKLFAPPVTGEPAFFPDGLDDGPAFTPDGRRIIFTRCCPPLSGYALWSIHADGTHLRQVTDEAVPPGVDGPSDNLPQVSPDGRAIAFHRNLGSCGCYIATVDLLARHLSGLTDPAMSAQIPNWSPDGRRIVFQALSNVWAVRRDGTGLTQLTFDTDATPDFGPSYSPDGRTIIFYRLTADGQRDLYTMHPDGSHVRLLRHTADQERFPQWAPRRGEPSRRFT
jgi:Tol biopolymer transport system component